MNLNNFVEKFDVNLNNIVFHTWSQDHGKAVAFTGVVYLREITTLIQPHNDIDNLILCCSCHMW